MVYTENRERASPSENKKQNPQKGCSSMKRTVSILMAAALVLGLTACNSTTSSSSSAPESSVSSEASSEVSGETPSSSAVSEESEEGEPASGSNVLVVYFSATGNTEQAAQYIAEATGGDLFELEPAEPYTDEDLNWTTDGSRVNQEHEDESLRDVELVADTVDNWDQYDTVFIGYPIWWGIAAWPVDGFVEANDFTGKTVIPFCTSSSSGIGQSGELLAELAGTGDWQEGQRFSSGVSQEDVDSWVSELGL